MKIKITKYDAHKNEFECDCFGHPEWDRFDPFVSGINNGDEYLEENKAMVGRTIEIDVFNSGRTLLLDSVEGEKKYKELVETLRTNHES